MKLRPLWQGVGLVALSALLILVISAAGLLALVYRSSQINQFWNFSLVRASEALTRTAEGYAFTGQDLLEGKEGLWLMLLDDQGQVVWQWHKPAELPDHYDLKDVASFTRWYLDDYPVQTLVRGDGLLVAGSSKGGTWKYSLAFDQNVVSMMPLWFLFLVLLSLG